MVIQEGHCVLDLTVICLKIAFRMEPSEITEQEVLSCYQNQLILLKKVINGQTMIDFG